MFRFTAALYSLFYRLVSKNDVFTPWDIALTTDTMADMLNLSTGLQKGSGLLLYGF